MKVVMFFPFGYGISTRAKTVVSKISLVCLIFVPNLMYSYYSANEQINPFHFILAFSILYSAYEIGYIYNDVLTTRFEQKPTKWLAPEKVIFVEKTYEIIIGSRVCWIAFGLYILSFIGDYNIDYFMFSLAVLHIVYGFHNYYRDKRNILTVFFLQVIKYGALPILFGSKTTIWYITAGIIQIGLVRTYEYAGYKKFISISKEESIDIRRVLYYLFLLIVALIIYSIYEQKGFLFISIYLLMFRIICLVVSKNKYVLLSRKRNG